MKIIALITMLLSFSPDTILAETKYERKVEKWTVVKPPQKSHWRSYQDFFEFANYSKIEWVVRNESGEVFADLKDDIKQKPKNVPRFDTKVKLETTKGPAPAQLFLQVNDGWIAAYNLGEFGSAVYWFDDSGKAKRKISDDQINEFMIDQDRIFAVQGLAHLGNSKGSMIELCKEARNWVSEEFIPLPESAEAIAKISSGEYVIVTTDMLLRVNLRNNIYLWTVEYSGKPPCLPLIFLLGGIVL